MARRKRELSAEEADLWGRVARTAAPMHRKGWIAPEQEPMTAAPIPAPPAPVASVRSVRSALLNGERPQVHLAPDPIEALAAAPSRLDGRRADRLRRGKLQPEARLDLHGMRRDEAHAALVSFVLGAQAAGKRLVLVITGKGRPDLSDSVIPERTGVLRHSLPHWLNAPPLTGRVVEVRPAHLRHGGAGALYLYLRRRVR